MNRGEGGKELERRGVERGGKKGEGRVGDRKGEKGGEGRRGGGDKRR